MLRIVVAIDPPGGSDEANAECGIVIAGVATTGTSTCSPISAVALFPSSGHVVRSGI